MNGKKNSPRNLVFSARKVDIGKIAANLKVSVNRVDQISVTIEGSGIYPDCIDVRENGDQVCIRGPETSTKETTDTQVNVSIPPGTSVCIHNIRGIVDIEEVDGTLKLIDVTAAKIGKIHDAFIVTRENSQVTIKQISGTLMARVGASSKITIAEGFITMLDAQVVERGEFTFQGIAENASVELSYDGKADIRQIINELTATIKFSSNTCAGLVVMNGPQFSLLSINTGGNINIKNMPQGLYARITNDQGLIVIENGFVQMIDASTTLGKTTFRGFAREAILKGNVEINHVEKQPLGLECDSVLVKNWIDLKT